MKARRLLAIPAVLMGCADHPGPSEPALEEHSANTAETPAPVETPIADVEALEISAEMRTAIRESLTAALAELELQPYASMSTLQDFFKQVEAQQAKRRRARTDLLRTVHP
ncbi:MAG: hypothetical protein ACREM1_04840 [Longimicrobiales bacterium]